MQKQMPKNKKVGLALGGGGAKSFAHLGVIKVLQENNIPIDYLATCSGGSIMGSMIAGGVSVDDIMEEFYKTVKKINWLRPKINMQGFISQQNIKSILMKFCEDSSIEDLSIPLGIVATNLNEGKLRVFTEGNLISAVCASSAFPGIYQPVEIEGELYVDGGVLNSTPADVCREKVGRKGIVISISLDDKLNSTIYKNNTFGIVYRSLYIPLIANRKKIISENSDIIINVFNDQDFNFSNWRDTLRFYSENKMQKFYLKGREEANKRIEEIKDAVVENKSNFKEES
ncbi:MAG TPA: patatin-like phospholipase family protein [Clostridiales bacterium]|nr:patatin-like phospholipase family protein [Clostridiales bacterium]HQP70472.1 patatin-like phospholipase family protein [Clostridiales bacterium]